MVGLGSIGSVLVHAIVQGDLVALVEQFDVWTGGTAAELIGAKEGSEGEEREEEKETKAVHEEGDGGELFNSLVRHSFRRFLRK